MDVRTLPLSFESRSLINQSDYPSYELYTENLRKGVFAPTEENKGRQLRLVVDKDRKVCDVVRI